MTLKKRLVMDSATSTAYRINVKDGLLYGVRNALSNVFEAVVLFSEVQGTNTPDFVIEPRYRTTLAGGDFMSGTMHMDSQLALSVQDFQSRYEYAIYADTQRVIWSPTSADSCMTILTGLSLFLLAPITFPIAVQSNGREGERLFEKSLNKSIDVITDQMIRDKDRLLHAAITIGPDEGVPPEQVGTNAPATEQAPSKYDDVLDCVVVIRNSTGLGSGFFVSKKGYIISNHHVVGFDTTVSVRLRSGKTVLGQVLKADKDRDLALIKVDSDNCPWLSLASAKECGIGVDVIAVGAPQGLDWSVAKGIISAVRTRSADRVKVVQTDAPINPGNSGGPLVELNGGKVVGVNTYGYRKDIAEGLNFAVSSDEILAAFPELKE